MTFLDITERKQLLNELADRESHLRRVIDNMLNFVGVLDTNGVLQEVNETTLLAGGLTREDVIGKPFWECYWWSHDEQVIQDLKAAVASALTGEVVRYDVEVRMAGESRLYEIFGYTDESFVPTKAGFLDAAHPDDRPQLELMIKSVFTQRCAHHEVEFRVIRGDNGEVVWTHCRGTIQRDADGSQLSILSVAVDVAERKERELSLSFMSDLHSRLAALTTADEIIAEAGKRVAEYPQLSHFLVVEMNTTAERADVISDFCSDDSPNLVGIYDMSEFATDEERRQLAAGLPMVVNDTAAATRSNRFIENFDAMQIGSLINAPSNRDARLQFMISATKRHPHVWRENEIDLLRQLANVVRLKLERSYAEAALRDSEERFRDLADNISQFTWMADATGSISWYSQQWFDCTGTTLKEMKHWGWKSVQHPDHLDRVVSSWTQALESGEVWDDTFPLRSKDGSYGWFFSRARPIRDADGNIQRWFGTNTDVTDAKLASEALQESQEQLRLGIEVADFALAEIDYATDTLLLSPEAARLYGLGDSETKVTRDQIHQTFHPDDRNRLERCIEKCLDTDEGGEIAEEHRIVMPGGAVRWLSIRKRIYFDRSTKVRRPKNGILAARDVTSHKQWEIELQDRETHLRRVINNQLGLVGVIDRNGILVEVDDRFMSIAGLTREDVIGRHFSECAWWTYDENVANDMREAMAKVFAGETVRYDVGLYAQGNQRLMIDFMMAPVFDDDGNVEYLIASGVDICERKLAEEQLLQARGG